MKFYVDACVLIYLMDINSPFQQRVQHALTESFRNENTLVSSDLVRLESRIKPLKDGQHEILAEFDTFFHRNVHIWCNFSRPVFDLATQLRAEHGLKTPDALHLAAAITHGCNEFWTNDNRLQKAASAHLQVINVFAAQELS